jgi:RNA polymerase sigma-70 factor (ECF subfamily)
MVPSMTQSAIEPGEAAPAAKPALDFDAVYEAHFAFVWRSLRRFGVPEQRLDDATQDVFLVVHRRLAEFEQRSSPTTWLYGIVVRVARDYRRKVQRKESAALSSPPEALDALSGAATSSPFERAAQSEAIHLLHELIAGMDQRKREVFLLAELDQMTAPEISAALGIEISTVYSRLHAARAAFEDALRERRARERGSAP